MNLEPPLAGLPPPIEVAVFVAPPGSRSSIPGATAARKDSWVWSSSHRKFLLEALQKGNYANSFCTRRNNPVLTTLLVKKKGADDSPSI